MVFRFSTWYFLPSNTSCLLKKSSEVRKHPLSMLNWSDWNYQVGLTEKDRLNPKISQTIGKNPKRKVSRCKDSQHKRDFDARTEGGSYEENFLPCFRFFEQVKNFFLQFFEKTVCFIYVINRIFFANKEPTYKKPSTKNQKFCKKKLLFCYLKKV